MSEWRYLNLNDGARVMIDVQDFERVARLRWRVFNARADRPRIATSKNVNGRQVSLLLAKFILDPPQGARALLKVSALKNGVLDYRRSNLFVGTRREQQWLRSSGRKHKSSKYKGVSFNRNSKKWQANIRPNGKLIYLGRFDCEESAARAYNHAAIEHFGELAFLNEVENLTDSDSRKCA